MKQHALSYAFRETEKAILVDTTGWQLHWCPKSVCDYDEDTQLWLIPEWASDGHYERLPDMPRWKRDKQTEISWWSTTCYEARKHFDKPSFIEVGGFGDRPTDPILQSVENYTKPKTGWGTKYYTQEKFSVKWTHDESSNGGIYKNIPLDDVKILQKMKMMSQLKYLNHEYTNCYLSNFVVTGLHQID